MMGVDDDGESRDQDIDSVLDSIRQDAAKIVDGVEALDPDELIDRFGQEAADLSTLIAREESAAQEQADSVASVNGDFGTLLESAIQRLIIGAGSPVLLRTSLDANLPAVAGHGPEIAKLCDAALRLAIDHAGDGGYLSITTRTESECAIFEITAEPGFEGSEVASSGTCQALEGHVEAADGELSMAVDTQGVLHAAITLLSSTVS